MSLKTAFVTRVWLLGILGTLFAGCASGGRPIRYYRIEVPSASVTSEAASTGISLQIGNLEVPPIMRDGRILYQVGAHEVGAYEYHRWVETPDRMVQSLLVHMLRASGKFQSVDTPRSGIRADYFVQGHIHEFSEIDKPEIYSRVSMEIEVHDARNFRTVWSRAYIHDEPVRGREVPDVVDSLDKNLRDGLTEIVSGMAQFLADRAAATTSKPKP